MSTGHPGMCLYVDRCLRKDAGAGLTGKAVRIHVSYRQEEDFRTRSKYFYESYLAVFKRDGRRYTESQPDTYYVEIEGKECLAMNLLFPLYDRTGEVVEEYQELPVVFTSAGLKMEPPCCGTIDASGNLVE